MDREDRCNRQYGTTKLPTLRDGYTVDTHRELLFKVYDQVCVTWRELVGVRFKLLAIVLATALFGLFSVGFTITILSNSIPRIANDLHSDESTLLMSKPKNRRNAVGKDRALSAAST